MTSVAKADLQKDLYEYLERVRAGEEVLVTEAGTPVAKLVPVEPERQGQHSHLEELIRTGRARGPVKPLTPEFFQTLPVGDDPQGMALRALLEERESGW